MEKEKEKGYKMKEIEDELGGGGGKAISNYFSGA